MKRLASLFLVLLLCVSLLPAALAEENVSAEVSPEACLEETDIVTVSSEEPAVESEPMETEVTETVTAFAEDGAANFSFDIAYDTPVKCGTPTTFTLNVTGTDASKCMYYLGCICVDSLYSGNYVKDPSRNNYYQTSNTFEFTFYTSGNYCLRFYVMDKGTTPVSTCHKDIVLTISDPNYPSTAEICASIVEKCEKTCTTDYDKALWLHDWLVENCKYDYSYLYCSEEGALARGTGTCEAYHRAYCMLLDEAGIENGRIEGNYHVWTAVKIDGEWCQVDVTWDDDGYSPSYSDNHYLYFGLNDAIMTKVHSDHTPNAGYESNTLENNYFIRSGKVSQWSDGFVDAIKQKIADGETSFSVAVTSSDPDGYLDVKYALAAYDLQKRITTDANGELCAIQCAYHDRQIDVSVIFYPLSYDANGGKNAPEEQKKVPGTALTISELEPSRLGYIFLGWSVEPEAETAQYRAGDAYEKDAAATLYAVWQKNYEAGDLNGDGKVSISDAVRLLQYLSGKNVEMTYDGNVTGDGGVTVADILRLLKYLLGENVVIY